MSIAALLTDEITFVRTLTETRDEIGATSPETEQQLTVAAYVEPLTGKDDMTEDRGNRNTQLGTWRAWVPAGTDVDGWDRVEYRGRSMEILGPPARFRDPLTQAEHHVEILLRETV